MIQSDPTAEHETLRGLIEELRLIVCVGSGGVGKTTTAAAIGIEAALAGRRAIVVTIDPARRLANSLGLEALGNDERPIPVEKFTSQGLEPQGSLHAMMLDTRATFDELIQRVSPDKDSRNRVLGNRVYRHISDTLSASHDYMASEKLYDLYNSEKYDLVVLDTPPMKNAIDFLEAPGRLSRFLDDKIVGWFLKPHGQGRILGTRLLQAPGAVVYRLLGNVFGEDFLDEIAEFFVAFKDLISGFRERAEEVRIILEDELSTRFVIVCSPKSTSMEEARYFHRQLDEREMPGQVFIVNRAGRFADSVRGSSSGRYLGDGDRAWAKLQLKDLHSPEEHAEFFDRLEAHFDRCVALAKNDATAIEGLRSFAGSRATVATVPRLPDDVYDFKGLLTIGRHLFGRSKSQ